MVEVGGEKHHHHQTSSSSTTVPTPPPLHIFSSWAYGVNINWLLLHIFSLDHISLRWIEAAGFASQRDKGLQIGTLFWLQCNVFSCFFGMVTFANVSLHWLPNTAPVCTQHCRLQKKAWRREDYFGWIAMHTAFLTCLQCTVHCKVLHFRAAKLRWEDVSRWSAK